MLTTFFDNNFIGKMYREKNYTEKRNKQQMWGKDILPHRNKWQKNPSLAKKGAGGEMRQRKWLGDAVGFYQMLSPR